MHASATKSPDFSAIQDLLACPHCHGRLNFSSETVVCAGCGATFPIRDGFPLLAVMDEPELKAASPQKGPTRESYQQGYQKLDRAAKYNIKYEQKLLKRWSTRREYHLLNRLLSSQPRCQTLLELPCGGGRLSPAMTGFTDLHIMADVAVGQLQYGREHSSSSTPQVWLTASALRAPFRDASVDGIVCIRLAHHLPLAAEREKLLSELLRVTRRFLIITFFDHDSLKNLLRRASRPFNKKRPKYTMTREEVSAIAAKHGARLEVCPALSLIGSGHRYALLVKS